MRALVALLAVLVAGCAAPAPVEEPATWACDPCARVLDGTVAPVWEPSAAADPADPDHIVVAYRDGSSDSIVTSVTRDGGRTWQKGAFEVGRDDAASEWTHTGDAVVAFSPEGDVWLAGLGFRVDRDPASATFQRTGASIFVARSEDGGVSFGAPSIVAEGDGLQVGVPGTPVTALTDYRNEDKEWLAIGADGTILVAWTALHPGTGAVAAYPEREPNTLYASISEDAGASWSDPIALDAEGSPSGAYPFIASDGTMHVAYRFYGEARSFVTTSRDDGATWERVEVGTARGQPTLVELTDGTLLLAFPAAAGDDATAPALARSTDGGVSWSEPQTFATASEGVAHVSLAARGKNAYLGWYGGSGESGRYRVAVLQGNADPIVFDVGDAAPDWGRYGDYVTGVTAHASGFSAIWNAEDEDGILLRHARYALG